MTAHAPGIADATAESLIQPPRTHQTRYQFPVVEDDLARQRAVVDAYFAAAREGDLEALVSVLDPGVVARSHGRTGVFELRGAEKVARAAMAARRFAPFVRPALINGTAGAVAFDGDSEQGFVLGIATRAGRDDRLWHERVERSLSM